RGTGAQEDVGIGRRVGIPPWRGAQQELAKHIRPAADVSADAIRVVVLEITRTRRAPCEHDVAEPGRKTLYLALDTCGHVDVGAVGHMAVGPAGVFAGGGPGRVEVALLCHQYERILGDASGVAGLEGTRDRFRALAEVNRCGMLALVGRPWNSLRQRVVDLEDPGPIAEARELPAISG